MKLIILSAFMGRLRSEPMEWPNEPEYIDLPIAKQSGGNWQLGKDVCFDTLIATDVKVGRFQRTGYQVLSNNRTAIIYELVGL